MKRTSLSTNFTFWPPPVQPPRASFDDDRDLEEKSKVVTTGKMFDIEHWEMIDGEGSATDAEPEEYDLEQSEMDDDIEKRWFAFEVENVPPSLKLLVRIFRLFSFSFSGIVFKTTHHSYFQSEQTNSTRSFSCLAPLRRPSSASHTSVTTPPRSFQSRFISTLALTMNLLAISTYIFPLLVGPFEMRRDATNWFVETDKPNVSTTSTSTTNRTSFVYMDYIATEEEYWNEFLELKPILRSITKSTFYIFMFDGFLQYILNLVLGGRLIARIARLPDASARHDPDYKLGFSLLLGNAGVILAYASAGALIFNQRQFKTLLEIVFGAGLAGVSKEDMILLGKTGVITCAHLFHYFLMTMVSLFFVYSMVVCRRVVEEIRAEVAEAHNLTESQLYAIKTRLTLLSQHFTGIVRYFSLPLTINMIANALLLVSTSCFLLIHKFQDDDYYITFIFNLGAFAFCRLVIVCTWGNAVMNAHRELVREIYESMAEWSLPTWMAFLEIKRLGEKFEVNIGGIYSVKQSAILTVLGFALNYIVVLLQTENYGGKGEWGGGGEGTNETSAVGGWDLMRNETEYR